MKADGFPCVNQCGNWVEETTYICPICKEDRFCSKECFWQGIPKCSDYKQHKNEIQAWTPRSVVNRVFNQIRKDRDMIQKLASKLEDSQHMIVFYTQDEETLATLLSNNENWKTTILSSVESRKSLEPTDSVMSFQFAIYCSKTKTLDCRLL